jgi:subtilisin family serine protease
MVINMSLGGDALDDVEKAALDRAIANGVIVVAAAGNEGEEGMHFPGAYPPVISAGSVGWTGEWLLPGTEPNVANRYRMWWLQNEAADSSLPSLGLPAGSGDVPEPTPVDEVYVSDFSSRELTSLGQELDVMAPGSWVRGPFPGFPGYSHLPWWSRGIGDLVGRNPGNFYYVGGTSMATPHVASVAALMLEANPDLTQAEVESILKSTTIPLPPEGSRVILDNTVVATITWDTYCDPVDLTCDPVGSGLIQADEAVAAAP